MAGGHADSELNGILEVFVHHARNIHNICIYDNQDVYAKFSLTYNPDETLSTQIVVGGGKNPDFNEKLMLNINQNDAVLKCEIWMHSRAKSYMEDQLLGFALVPISQIVNKGKVTQDYNLSSTDLFHSPAGKVRLTLSLNTNLSISSSTKSFTESSNSSSISSEVVILDPVEYSRIEFPDINIVTENQQMVSEYFSDLNLRPRSFASFLHLGASSQLAAEDYEMTVNSSSITSLSDHDGNSSDSMDKKCRRGIESSRSPDTPTSKKDNRIKDEKQSEFSSKEDENNNNRRNSNESNNNMNPDKYCQVFSTPNLEAEQAKMQQQIVDMYMKSMQQFTESLANMKLPMDLDNPERDPNRDDVVIQNGKGNNLEAEKKKNDGSRVFYGSRAFF